MAKFVVRLVDDQHTVLAWAEVQGEYKSLGRHRCEFWPVESPTKFLVTTSGKASAISVHWTDYDLARHVQLPSSADVAAGLLLDFKWHLPVWALDGEDIPLNAVTVGQSVSIESPTGSLTQVT